MIGRRNRRPTPPLTNEQIAVAGTFLVALAAVGLTVKLVRSRGRRHVVKAPQEPILSPEADVADEIRRVARTEIDEVIAALTTDEQEISQDAVHTARKGIKRVRALLRLVRQDIGGKLYAAENDALRQIAHRLSDARDSDVMVQTLDLVLREYADEIPAGAFANLRSAFATKAGSERAMLSVRANAARGAVAELHALRARVAGWPLPADGDLSDLRAGALDVYQRGRDASDAVAQRPTTKRMHRLRRRTKDLVHTAQLLETVAPTARKLVKRGKAVNDILGEEHDLAMLRDGAAAHAETMPRDHQRLLQALIDRRRDVLKRQATDHAGLLYSRPPKKAFPRFGTKQ